MGNFTYEFPDPRSFLYTLREYLESQNQKEIAELLIDAACEFSSYGQFSKVRWDSMDATIRISVPISVLHKFDEEKKKQILQAADLIFPQEAGYELSYITISPFLISPPKDNELLGNTAILGSIGKIEHDGLRFRSKSEIKIYEELKRQKVLFFANATAVLGMRPEKREPDFLVCQDGKWGILEVMGDLYHPSATAMRDHDRARLFKEYGLFYIEFFDAKRCYSDPTGVVSEFLRGLEKQ